MRPLHLVIESALVSAAKLEEAYGHRMTWPNLARHVADDPDLAEAYALLARERARAEGGQ
jgi:hypothetical protein